MAVLRTTENSVSRPYIHLEVPGALLNRHYTFFVKMGRFSSLVLQGDQICFRKSTVGRSLLPYI